MPEKQNVHADHDNYQRDHQHRDGCSPAHGFVLPLPRSLGKGSPARAARSSTTKSVDAAAGSPHERLAGRHGCRLRDYLALRRRKPKPSERVRVAVNVSNSTGVGNEPEPDQADVW